MARSRLLGSVLRTLAILDLLAASDHAMGASEIAQHVDADRSSVFQQLQTLVKAEWVEQLDSSAYRLTLKAFPVGRAALAQAGLGDRLGPWIDQLAGASGETASLVSLRRDRAVVVSRKEPSVAMKVNIEIGDSLNLARSASGRILTAMLDPADLDRIRDAGVPTASDELLATFRERGWSDQHDELVGGMSSVAIPLQTSIGERVALSLAGPTGRFEIDAALELLQAASRNSPPGILRRSRADH